MHESLQETIAARAWSPPKRFYLLDALRGVAALSVVFWHWQHFFRPFNAEGVSFVKEQQPFFSPLSFLYEHGGGAVHLFFCLSGFVFFWLYSKSISNGATSAVEFSVLRFSRLYPLHFVTLLIVAIGQVVHMSATNTQFVYQFNDPFHFFLNLVFASNWGFQQGRSFNGPVWSVSIEVLLYLIFFVTCKLRLSSTAALLVITLFSAGPITKVNAQIGLGLASFFVGGLTYRTYAALVGRKLQEWLLIALLAATAVTWILTVLGASDLVRTILESNPRILRLFPVYFLYPLTILTLALADTRWTIGKKSSILGDLSYSSYLIHFPLQLLIATSFAVLKLDPNLFYSPMFFLLFFSVLILLSLTSHNYFEMPAQRWLRKRLLSERVTNT